MGYRLLSIRDRLPVAEFAFVSAGWDAVELRGDPSAVVDELVAYVGSTFPADGFSLCDATTLPPSSSAPSGPRGPACCAAPRASSSGSMPRAGASTPTDVA